MILRPRAETCFIPEIIWVEKGWVLSCLIGARASTSGLWVTKMQGLLISLHLLSAEGQVRRTEAGLVNTVTGESAQRKAGAEEPDFREAKALLGIAGEPESVTAREFSCFFSPLSAGSAWSPGLNVRRSSALAGEFVSPCASVRKALWWPWYCLALGDRGGGESWESQRFCPCPHPMFSTRQMLE